MPSGQECEFLKWAYNIDVVFNINIMSFELFDNSPVQPDKQEPGRPIVPTAVEAIRRSEGGTSRGRKKPLVTIPDIPNTASESKNAQHSKSGNPAFLRSNAVPEDERDSQPF